jgi:hypothetical protein
MKLEKQVFSGKGKSTQKKLMKKLNHRKQRSLLKKQLHGDDVFSTYGKFEGWNN